MDAEPLKFRLRMRPRRRALTDHFRAFLLITLCACRPCEPMTPEQPSDAGLLPAKSWLLNALCRLPFFDRAWNWILNWSRTIRPIGMVASVNLFGREAAVIEPMVQARFRSQTSDPRRLYPL